jgi:hypothetical protein
MFDVYVKETHPGMNFQPRTFEERIQLYKEYQQEYGMTIPTLVDNMKNEWLELYAPGPTGCILIDKRGIVVYTIQFVMSGNSYNTIDNEVSKLLGLIDQYSFIPDKNSNTLENSFSINQSTSGRISVIIPSGEPQTVEIFNMRGTQIFSGSGFGSTEYHINKFMSAGKYVFRIITGNRTIIKPVILHK